MDLSTFGICLERSTQAAGVLTATNALPLACGAVPMICLAAISIDNGYTKDKGLGTSRNTTEAVIGSVGGVAVGSIGSVKGAMIGNMVLPGVGGVAGAMVGGGAGFLVGDYCTKKAISPMLDHWRYDIEVMCCKKCNRRYYCRVYTEQSRTLCIDCDGLDPKDL